MIIWIVDYATTQSTHRYIYIYMLKLYIFAIHLITLVSKYKKKPNFELTYKDVSTNWYECTGNPCKQIIHETKKQPLHEH